MLREKLNRSYVICKFEALIVANISSLQTFRYKTLSEGEWPENEICETIKNRSETNRLRTYVGQSASKKSRPVSKNQLLLFSNLPADKFKTF